MLSIQEKESSTESKSVPVRIYQGKEIRNAPLVVGIFTDASTGEGAREILSNLDQCNWVAFAQENAAKKIAGSLSGQDTLVNPFAVRNYFVGQDPALVVTGVSVGNGSQNLERLITWVAGKRGVPTLWFMQGPGGLEALGYTKLWQENRGPEYLCVPDEPTRQRAIRQHTLPPEYVFVTGNPTLDAVAHKCTSPNKAVIKKTVYEALGLKPDQKIVVFSGQQAGTVDALGKIVPVLAKYWPGSEYVFAARLHPMEIKNNLAGYQEQIVRLQERGITCLMANSDKVSDAADLMVSASFNFAIGGSTVAYMSAQAGVPTACLILNEETRKQVLSDTQIQPEELPIVSTGSALGLFENSDIDRGVRRLFTDPKTQDLLRQNASKFMPNDGKSGERVAKVILNLLKTSS